MADTVQTIVQPRTTAFERLAGLAHHRRWWAVAAWVAIWSG
jgi:hypothetical protein